MNPPPAARRISRSRKLARRLVLWLKSPAMHVVTAPEYSLRVPLAAVDGRRPDRILSWLDEQGLVAGRNLHRARIATMQQLGRVHGTEYLDSLQAPDAMLPILGVALADEDQDRFLESQRSMVGGTILASRLALRFRVPIFSLGGGLHHALADRGQGFCAFHDVAIAISLLRRDGWIDPILILDLDLHDGEGTRAIFATDPTVHTLSIHNEDLGTSTALESTSVALGKDVEDTAYLQTVRRTVIPLLERFRPKLVFYVAGADVAAGDGLGNWNLKEETVHCRDRLIREWVHTDRKIPFVYLPAGGYGLSAWRFPAFAVAEAALGDLAPSPPETLEMGLREFRRIASVLSVGELTSEPETGWRLTEEDLMPGQPVRSRLLGYYSKHGLELALERYGVFEHLRTKGFDDVALSWDLSGPSGETVWIHAKSYPEEPLAEIRMRRDRTLLPGRELLFVEWLLLQDPSAEFAPSKPRLPGQVHPGLNLLGRVVAILILVCERVGLDALAFTPTSYHIAAQTSSQFRFLSAEAEARFRALRRLLGKRSLSEAAQLLEQRRVVSTSDGKPVDWVPSTMMLPVSPELVAEFSDGDDGTRFREFSFDFKILPSDESGSAVS